MRVRNYDMVTVDSPRKVLKGGCSEPQTRKPENTIYISCNTLAFSRDYQNLKGLYKIEDAILVDMFLHTPHTEAVIKFRHC
ncbi:hypothetical protein DRN44_08245 [Thermococci archaeon]|nr:MAG: hypothetical protein DRN44_08245 [Thermococci archaeon]